MYVLSHNLIIFLSHCLLSKDVMMHHRLALIKLSGLRISYMWVMFIYLIFINMRYLRSCQIYYKFRYYIINLVNNKNKLLIKSMDSIYGYS